MERTVAQSFTVGDVECRVIPDGVAAYDPEFVFPDVPPEVLRPLLRGRLDEEGMLPSTYNPLLVRAGGTTVLIDAGAGRELAGEWGDPVGRARESLVAAGVLPQVVDLVLITHAHPDHVGGLTVPEGDDRAPVFPRARHLIWKGEWDFWASGEHRGMFAEMAGTARTHLEPLREAGLLELVDGEAEVASGIRVFPTPGHTPGHMSVAVESGGERAIVAGDVVLTEWAFEHPDWNAAPEALPEVAAWTRRNLLERACREGGLFQAFHLSDVGRLEEAGDAFRFAPGTG